MQCTSMVVGLMAGALFVAGCQGARGSVDEIVMGAEEVATGEMAPALAQRYERCEQACMQGNMPGWEVHSSCLSAIDGANVCIARATTDADAAGASCAVPCPGGD